MIYSINEARNVEEYKAEKAAREKAEQDKKDKQYSSRYKSDKLIHDVDHLYATKNDKNGNTVLYNRNNVGSKNRNTIASLSLINGKKQYTKMQDSEDGNRLGDSRSTAIRNAKYDSMDDLTDRYQTDKYADAVNRNMRRHPERWDGDKPVKPKSESTIFDNVEIV